MTHSDLVDALRLQEWVLAIRVVPVCLVAILDVDSLVRGQEIQVRFLGGGLLR